MRSKGVPQEPNCNHPWLPFPVGITSISWQASRCVNSSISPPHNWNAGHAGTLYASPSSRVIRDVAGGGIQSLLHFTASKDVAASHHAVQLQPLCKRCYNVVQYFDEDSSHSTLIQALTGQEEVAAATLSTSRSKLDVRWCGLSLHQSYSKCTVETFLR